MNSDDPSAHVPVVPWGQHLDEAYKALDRAFLDAKPVEPRAHVIPGDEGIMGRISDALRMIDDAMIEGAPPARTEPIKLTEQQITAIRSQQPEQPAWNTGVVADLFAVPIEKVDTAEESTPYQEAPKYATGGIIRASELGPLLGEGGCSYVIPNRHDPDAVPGGIINIAIGKLTDEDFRKLERRWLKKHGGTRNAHRVKLLGRHPWPWWKRAYYQVRRWLA